MVYPHYLNFAGLETKSSVNVGWTSPRQFLCSDLGGTLYFSVRELKMSLEILDVWGRLALAPGSANSLGKSGGKVGEDLGQSEHIWNCCLQDIFPSSQSDGHIANMIPVFGYKWPRLLLFFN